MKTAEELINDCNHEMLDENGKLSKVLFTQGEVEGMMLKFAKYHVIEALKKANKRAEKEFVFNEAKYYKKLEDSILNAYPLDQIK